MAHIVTHPALKRAVQIMLNPTNIRKVLKLAEISMKFVALYYISYSLIGIRYSTKQLVYVCVCVFVYLFVYREKDRHTEDLKKIQAISRLSPRAR